MTITITHPGARLLAPALDALADVVGGDWTPAAQLCVNRLADPNACASDLRALAARAGVTRAERRPYRYRVWHRMLLVDEHPSLLAAALDLHTNLVLGRWDALERVALPTRRPSADWCSAELLEVRIRHQQPGSWSEHPYVTESLFEAPPAARLAHHVLTQIKGGPACCYDIPAGSPSVHVG